MRYLGNKDSIVNEIVNLIESKVALSKDVTLFDCFCGTGSVCNEFKDKCKIVINDNLKLATTYTFGKLVGNSCKFKKLGFDPIDYFNSNEKQVKGFFSKNYSPKLSNRMYFSDKNAGRIDYFRKQIEDWYNQELLSDNEYQYLLGCLLESVSKVANVAGVYGAYLKEWDKRAVKDIKFLRIECDDRVNILSPVMHNKNISEIIDKVKCDILYIDPPYTKNKYSVQYHILETLILNDNPKINGITGCRQFDNVSNDWSINNKVEIEFENIIAKTSAKHIFFSYSDDGLLSKEYILNVFKRYGVENSIEFKEIVYKKYRNYKTKSSNIHKEYLFYMKKKDLDDVEFYCPLNYMGGKSNVIKFIKPYLNNKNVFFDIMGGGFNVGINAMGFKKYVYNDINFIVKDLIQMFQRENTFELLKFIDCYIKKYSLDKHNKTNYIRFRNDYNKKYRFYDDYYKYLYVLLLYGFQQQLRFNSEYEFNNTVGESGYNDSIKEKIVSFSRRIKEIDLVFYNKTYEELLDKIDKNTLVYIDPPYLITLGSYNDGKRGFKGWNNDEEQKLINFFDLLIKKKCKLVISNILFYKGKENILLNKWITNNKRNLKIVDIEIRKRKEVLIIYE